MDAREHKAEAIAATTIERRSGSRWSVPSQSGKGRYIVDLSGESPTCTCPDYALRQRACKHILAVQFVLDGKLNGNGRLPVVRTKKPTYPQDWPAYNAAQTTEKVWFMTLVHDLCQGIEEPDYTFGRPRLRLADIVFSAAFKIYSTVSARRFMTDLREAHTKGYLKKVPHYNSIFNYLEMPVLTPLLQTLIIESSLPLKAVEVDFAGDSSGFTTSRFVRWFDHKYGVVRQQHDWVKVHLMCGVKTNIVTAIEIRDRDASDTKLLPLLVKTTAEHFTMEEVSADKGYSSVKNIETVAGYGAVPYIAFKSIHSGAAGGLWAKMFHFFQFRRDEFLTHYHKRSNVESTFSMIKAKFGDHVRSKTDVAMVNEVLCKVLCHNICCLIQSMYELGIEPTFWANNPEGRDIAPARGLSAKSKPAISKERKESTDGEE